MSITFTENGNSASLLLSEKYSSYVVAGLDSSTEACWSTTNTASYTSPLHSSVREAASRGKDVQGFQKFPGIEQKDAEAI